MNNYLKVILILILLCLLLVYKKYDGNHNNSIDFEKNILEFMQDGMGDDEIKNVLKEDIELVEDAIENNLTQVNIQIWYYEVDLNEDNLSDKIVIISSALHTGSAGDTFRILINKGGYYCSAEPFSNVELLGIYGESLDEDLASIYISKNTTNGYHDINIKSFDKSFTLKFDNDKYCVYQISGLAPTISKIYQCVYGS